MNRPRLAALVAIVLWGISFVATKAALRELSPVALVFGGWGALLFLGIGCSGLGYLLWYGALEKLEAGQVAVFLYLEPLVTLAAAAAWLGEPVGLMTAIGGLVVLAGVSVVQRRA